MNSNKDDNEVDQFEKLLSNTEITKEDELVQELQEKLTALADARNEDRFVFIFVCVILLDIVFFSVMENVGGPIALLILQLLILLPLARKMGLEQIAKLLDNVLSRLSNKMSNDE